MVGKGQEWGCGQNDRTVKLGLDMSLVMRLKMRLGKEVGWRS